MQVNPASSTKTTSEPVLNSAKPPEGGSASAFFAQIDQIWNSEGHQEADSGESELSTAAAGGIFHPGAGVCLLPDNPENTLPGDPDAALGAAVFLPVENAAPSLAGLETAADPAKGIPQEFRSVLNRAEESVAVEALADRTSVQSEPNTAQIAALNPDSQGNPELSVNAIATAAFQNLGAPASSSTLPGSRDAGTNSAAVLSTADSAENTNVPAIRVADDGGQEAKLDRGTATSGTQMETRSVDDLRAAGNAPEFKTESDSVLDLPFRSNFGIPDTKTKNFAGPVWSETVIMETRQGSLGFELPSMPGIHARDADVRFSESGIPGINVPKTAFDRETIAPAGQEKANSAESRAATAENSQSGSSTTQRNKSENSQVDFAAMSVHAGEKQEKFSVQYLSGSVRSMDTGAPAVSPRSGMADPRPPEFLVQLAERIQVQLRDGRGEIRIQLRPDSLGRLEIRAENTANGVVARILAESGTVKNYLETNLHLLQQSLQDQGLKIDRIQVSVQDNSGSSSPSGYAAQSGHAGPGHSGREVDPPLEKSAFPVGNQLEELSIDAATWIALNPNIRFYTVA